MNKIDLVRGVSERTGLNLKDSENAVNAFFESVIEGLAKGEKVILRGFGTFRVSERKARTVRNPKTGAKSQIGPRRSPLFKAGKHLNQIVNASQAANV